MEGPFTKQVARWCSNDLQQSMSSCFIKMAMLIDEKLKKDHDDIKKQRQAFEDKKAVFEKEQKDKAEEFRKKEVEVQKAVVSARELAKTKNELMAEKAKLTKEWSELEASREKLALEQKAVWKQKLTKEWSELEASREKLALEQKAVWKQNNDLAAREEKFARFEADRMKSFEEKEADVVKQEENVKSKERKLNELKKKFNETKHLFDEERLEAEKAIRDDKDDICRQKAELEEREHDIHFMEVELDGRKKEAMEKKQDSDRGPSEWIALDKWGNDPKLLGDNFGEFDRLKKVCKMMERNNAVVYIRTDYLTEISVGIKPSSVREVSRITSARGENEKQCLKDLGDELLKRFRNTFTGSGRTPSVQSYQFRA